MTQRPLEARSLLLEFYDEAIAVLPPQDRFWAINALGAMAVPDQMAVARLKKRKLRLRDEMAWLEDRLVPDIIA